MQPGLNAAPMHPNCRCSCSAYEDSEEYEEWLDFLANGGTTEEYNKQRSLKIKYTASDKDSQNYKPVVLDSEDTIATEYKDLPCTATKAVGYDNDIYISDKVKIKPKRLNYVNTRVNKAAALVGAKDGYKKPLIIVCDTTELPTKTVAAYTATDNTLRISKAITSKEGILNLPKDGARYNNHNSVYVHEMLHWADAQEYINNHGKADGYLKSNIETSKKHIEKLAKSGYNIFEISSYAKRMLSIGRYDEVWTEYRVTQILGE